MLLALVCPCGMFKEKRRWRGSKSGVLYAEKWTLGEKYEAHFGVPSVFLLGGAMRDAAVLVTRIFRDGPG